VGCRDENFVTFTLGADFYLVVPGNGAKVVKMIPSEIILGYCRQPRYFGYQLLL
jgi:hypothetical protein